MLFAFLKVKQFFIHMIAARTLIRDNYIYHFQIFQYYYVPWYSGVTFLESGVTFLWLYVVCTGLFLCQVMLQENFLQNDLYHSLSLPVLYLCMTPHGRSPSSYELEDSPKGEGIVAFQPERTCVEEEIESEAFA
ncbi:hypothetical protein ACJX0J_035477 [Zea mays]